ncbi:hypothetical protein BRD00_01495 [Halobacteriales archaeon QS_8_69_26]|nr:MAG: hypothetical protein BRD00_01495 [Halobacteriales archaeon QS_8_69_26]
MVECDSCGANVEEETTCPDCGYSPRGTLLRNGVGYGLFTAHLVFVVTPVVVTPFDPPPLPTGAVVRVVVMVTGWYGVYPIIAGGSATVEDDLSGYVGLPLD